MSNTESKLILLYQGARNDLKESKYRYYSAITQKEITEINEEINLHTRKVSEAKAKLRRYRKQHLDNQKRSHCFYRIGIVVGTAMRIVSRLFWIFPPNDKDDSIEGE